MKFHSVSVALGILTLAVIGAAPVRGGITIGVGSVAVAPGGTGSLDLTISNSGPGIQNISGFALEISVPGASGITFTGVTTSTALTYVFSGDSFFGPNINTDTGSTIDAADISTSGTGNTLASGATFGIAHVAFTVAGGTPPGLVPVSLSTNAVLTNLSDSTGAGVSFTGVNGAITVQGAAPPITGAFQVHYATHVQSGFDGSFINITNDGSSSTLTPGGTGTATTSSGNLCVGVYFFDPNEELQACCACEVTPNGLISLSVKANNGNNLTSEFPDTEGVQLLAWSATSTSTVTGTIFGPGSPIQATLGASVCNAAFPGPLATGMQAWGTDLHSIPGGNFAMTETPFSLANLSIFEQSRLTTFCSYNQFAGSGNYGQCKGCQSSGLGAAAAQ